MTASVTELVEQTPRRTRSRVLFDNSENVAKTAQDNPDKWYLVGGGPKDRYGVYSQTAYRIRRGQISAFAAPQGGFWEALVSTDQRVEDRKHPVELYVRFVKVGQPA
jgi:hypothetical protein